MKKTLLSILAIGVSASMVMAQTFTPAGGSALTGGTLNMVYAGQTLDFTVPATATVDVAAISPIPIPGIPTVSADVTDVTWTVEGLPAGLTATCDIASCMYVANATGTITIAGTPTVAGTFTIDISSSTNGSATLPAPISQTIAFPQALPGLLDEDGYTMTVVDPNGIAEANETFSLGVYPNPTDGISTLDVNSMVAGNATIEVYSITGSMVMTSTNVIRIGANRLNLDLSSVPAGIYMVKADINGSQALVRMQKK